MWFKLSKENLEAALTETQTEILWGSILGVTVQNHVHFIMPHADGIFTKMTQIRMVVLFIVVLKAQCFNKKFKYQKI